jgi:outer membrane lipoprotein SlyB
MKNLITFLIIMMFGFGFMSCTAAQQGATLGGLGGMAGSALGKGDRSTTAIIGGVGAVTGYMIGNEIDKQRQSQQQSTYQQSQQPRTDCRKVVTRRVIDGVMTETIEEICEGQKTTHTY